MGALCDKIKLLEGDKTYSHEENIDYMSDMANWVCVHATKYEPKQNSKGELYLETTAMATGYKYIRSTDHFVLNGLVYNNNGGNWDMAPIVVLAPYNDIVCQNGNPLKVAVEDTYFTPNPNTGLILPENTYIVKPDPNCAKGIEIKGNIITYKSDGYTKEEIKDILSFDSWEKEKYNQYLTGQIPEYEVGRLLGYDEKLIKAYENSKNKEAFMRGVLEEDRILILNNILRKEAVKIALKQMGYHYVNAHEDEITGKVADVAEKAGLESCSGDKGHSSSVEYVLDHYNLQWITLAELLENKDVNQMVEYIKDSKFMSNEIRANIFSDVPIPDVYDSYEKVFKDYVADKKKRYEIVDESLLPEIKTALKKKIEALGNGGIKEYNPHLATAIHRHATRMKIGCHQALKEFKADRKAVGLLEQRLTKCDNENITFIRDNSR